MPSHEKLHFRGTCKGMQSWVLAWSLHAILLSEGVRLLRLLVLMLTLVLRIATSTATGGR